MGGQDDATPPKGGESTQGGRYEPGPTSLPLHSPKEPTPPPPADAEPDPSVPKTTDAPPPPPTPEAEVMVPTEPLVPADEVEAEDIPLDPTYAEAMPDVDLRAADDEPKTRFWVGTTKDCPLQSVVAGITFPRFTGSFQYDAHGNPIIPPNPGGEAMLTADKIEDVKARVARAVIRWRGNTAVLVSTGSSRYTPSTKDEPLGKYVFMVRVGAMMPTDWRKRIPPTLIRRE